MEDLKLHDYDEYIDDGNLIAERQTLPQQTTETDYNGLLPNDTEPKTQTVEQANRLYSKLMNVTPYSSRGGSNAIPSRNPNKKAKAKKRRIQKNSRKKNR